MTMITLNGAASEEREEGRCCSGGVQRLAARRQRHRVEGVINYDDDVIAQAVKHNLTAFSEHIRIQQSPTHSDVAILDDRHIMVARKELHPLSLIIIPRASGLRLAATDANEEITVDFAETREMVK